MKESSVKDLFAAGEQQGKAEHEVMTLREIWACVADKFTTPNFTVHRSENRKEIYIEHGTTGGDLEPSISVREAYVGVFYIGRGGRGEDGKTSTAEQVVKELGRFYGSSKNFAF